LTIALAFYSRDCTRFVELRDLPRLYVRAWSTSEPSVHLNWDTIVAAPGLDPRV
jgi:hypothetical protein